jgi:hypothetical protein
LIFADDDDRFGDDSDENTYRTTISSSPSADIVKVAFVNEMNNGNGKSSISMLASPATHPLCLIGPDLLDTTNP